MNEIATLSKHGAENASVPGHWDPLVAALSNVYSPQNPDGLVMLGLAESSLMHDEL
ncbi:hypothetical protein CLAFUW4_07111 [Fulvia fulva]|uniref:Uncharacterized protein n=1 Tax=Passalora fulva TaxID=5499 RepID=A0A9Q8PAV8_PASFU|nr:uncharacterized protein CLAFUR5_07245 [Fulvia fulva]KAK4621757.1 hypothetical protein CLAFUR4_07120 [Fulvia fulva]KAK4622896.1 hypothetical protein CLAFUR0_07118 [Fulvia fulva]UJO19109.1 hypothetical protein CLAFUR5_07245 [Fulvia fulva]WPV16425.1 hypothetical protein CLAFUW4_07111 [Fulvia fulva]WPV31217.1 hypothetical protein CLAFUW7_07112 [Fulvia fulva]